MCTAEHEVQFFKIEKKKKLIQQKGNKVSPKINK